MPDTILSSETRYKGAYGCAFWHGEVVADESAFAEYMRSKVHDYVADTESGDPFAVELRGLATTGVETEFIEKLLRAVSNPVSWEIGEALAQCIVSQDDKREIVWPWNTVRDRRAPRASLPGADLVGFCRQDDAVLLLFGEVKTSSDSAIPPNVMYGGSGMTWQLKKDATRLDVQHTLLKWLRTRCSSQEHADLYRAAVQRYLRFQGKEILLIGILLRDTQPDERDIKSRAMALANELTSPTRIEIIAWYLPVQISKWSALLQRGAA